MRSCTSNTIHIERLTAHLSVLVNQESRNAFHEFPMLKRLVDIESSFTPSRITRKG